MSDPAKITAILRGYLNKWIAEDRARWLATPYHDTCYNYWPDDGERPLDADIRETEFNLSRERARIGRRDFGDWDELIASILKEHGLGDEARPELGLGLQQVHLRVLEARLKRLRGEEPSLIDVTPSDAAMAVSEPAPAEAPAETQAVVSGPLFSEFTKSFIEYAKSAKELRGQTIAQADATYRLFIQACGDKFIGSYTRKDTGLFYDTLRKLPALWGKKREWRGLSIMEIVKCTEGQDVPRLTMKTIKRHFSALGPLFDYAKQRGSCDGENPAHGFEFPTKRGADRVRKAWDVDKLKKLFASPVWTGCHPYFRSRPGSQIIKDAKYWLPILALYHGNRLEEFAQLRREDVGRERDIHFFNLTDEDGRKLKNAQSRRRVPMHPTVIALGFLDHVKKAAPGDNVFPELRAGGRDDRLGYYVTKWWSEYRKKVGVYEKGQDYHSFRHTVITALFAAGVQQQYVELIAGHAGQGMSAGVYRDADKVPLQVLYEAICKLDWSAISPLFTKPQSLTATSERATVSST